MNFINFSFFSNSANRNHEYVLPMWVLKNNLVGKPIPNGRGVAKMLRKNFVPFACRSSQAFFCMKSRVK